MAITSSGITKSYTLSACLFIFVFLATISYFTKRTLEPSISPYIPRTDIYSPASVRPATIAVSLPDSIQKTNSSDVNFPRVGETAQTEDAISDGGGQTEETQPANSDGGGQTEETQPANSDEDVSSDGESEKSQGGDLKSHVFDEEDKPKEDESLERLVGFGNVDAEKMRNCDLYSGTWVRDEEYPIYGPGSCPYVDEGFDCQRNGRQDAEYLKWRWKPDGCDLPRFNATDFLMRLRGKRLMLVGDSMNRNQFESMLCVLREGLANKSTMYETHGYKITKGRGYYVFKFEDYDCTVEFVRSHFLVREGVRINGQGNSNPTLSIDRIDKTHARWKRADILVFNTGHWWVHGKTSRGKNYYKEGDYIYPKFNATEAFRRALMTWARWIHDNVEPSRQLVFYRGYSSAHFRGGDWDSGGTCIGEKEPISKGAILDSYPLKMKIVEEVLRETKVPVVLLNITKLTNFRKDGHPSIYGKMNMDGKQVSTRRQDCSHWCLPGVPDAWNELIYATLLLRQTA